MRTLSTRAFAVFVAALLVALTPLPSPGMNFDGEMIGPDGWTTSYGYDANAQGAVVGYYTDVTGAHGFIYKNGKVAEILPPGWTVAIPRGISDNGSISGIGTDGVTTMGFLYHGGTFTNLAPPGWTGLNFTGVNDSGQAAGSGGDGGISKGLLCNGGSCLPVIPPGWSGATCNGINEAGQMACMGTDGGVSKGFLYADGTYTEILPPGWASAQAWGINDSGQVVGTGDDGGTDSCFIYQGGNYTVIPPPPDMTALVCQTIGEDGSVAGYGIDSMGTYRVVIWNGGDYYSYRTPTGSYLFLPAGKMRGGLFTGFGLTPTPRAYAVRVTPAADLKAGPYDGPGTIKTTMAVSLTASLSAGIFKGARGDYWLIAQHPSGTYSFDAASQSWKPGIFPAAQGPLRDFSGKRVFATTGLPPGLHTFYLAVDMNMNGIPDAAEWHFDTLFFFVR